MNIIDLIGKIKIYKIYKQNLLKDILNKKSKGKLPPA